MKRNVFIIPQLSVYNMNCTPQSRVMYVCSWTRGHVGFSLCSVQPVVSIHVWFLSFLTAPPPPSQCFLFVDFTWSRSVWFCRDLPVRATGPWLHHRSGHPCHCVSTQIHFWPQPSATQRTPFIDICKSEHSQSVYICSRLHFLFELRRIIWGFWIC